MAKYQLEDCCRKALADIAEKQHMGKVLQKLVASSPFAAILGSGPIDAAVSLGSTDWDVWGQALAAVPSIVRNRCQLIAGLERLKHSGGKLNSFWSKMYDSFN